MKTPTTATNRNSRYPDGYFRTVREWAKANDIDVPRQGVVSNAILAQYEAANTPSTEEAPVTK
jgi:hypothetical protein